MTNDIDEWILWFKLVQFMLNAQNVKINRPRWKQVADILKKCGIF